MNCRHAEQQVLLKDSGELGAWGRWRLARHLARCAACRAYQDALLGITEAVRAWDAGDVSPEVRRRVRALRPETADRREVMTFEPAARPAWVPRLAFAAAALAAIAAGLWLAAPRTAREPAVAEAPAAQPQAIAAAADPWDGGVDRELDALNELLASAFGEGSAAAASSDQGEESDEDTLARELMELQGYAI